MSRKKIIISLAIATIVLGLLYIFNPADTILAPKCAFHAVTGLSCPGCGMQRFLHAFMHGHFAEAFHYNYLLVILLPYLTLLGIEELLLTGKTKERWKRVIEGRTLVITMIILAPSWFVIRNIFNI